MEELRKKFDRWYKKYVLRKPTFKEKIEEWSKAGLQKMYEKGSKLLDDAERHALEIRSDFNKVEKDVEKKALKSKIKIFKKLYKELHETTKPNWRQWTEALFIALVAIFFIRNFVFAFYCVPSGSAEKTLLVGDRVLGNNMAYLFGRKPKHGDYVMFAHQDFKFDKSNKFKYFWQKYIGFDIPFLTTGLTGPDYITKRVIACPGDTVEGKVEEGRTFVYLNGKKLNEPYVNVYPLIALEKKAGFIDFDRMWFLRIPDFLRMQRKLVHYSYDPEKDFSRQPFYKMHSSEVVLKPGTAFPWLKMAFTPERDHKGRIADSFGPIVLADGKYWVMGDSRKNSFDSRFWGPLSEERVFGKVSFVLYSIDSEESFWLLELLKHPIDFWLKSVRWGRFFKSIKSEPAKLE